jgi:hypothetical protein
VPPTIRGGAEWARTNLPVLFAGLRGFEAEALAVAGDVRAAAAANADVDGRLLRGDPGRGQVGAQHAYAAALVAYATGDVAAGDRELDKATAVARRRSPRLFQGTRLMESLLAGSNAFSDRQADALFATLLGDPSPRDVAIDPLDALAASTTPRTEAFDAWATVAARRGSDSLCVVARRERHNATSKLFGVQQREPRHRSAKLERPGPLQDFGLDEDARTGNLAGSRGKKKGRAKGTPLNSLGRSPYVGDRKAHAASSAMPFSCMNERSSPPSNISFTMSQPPTNSPFT